MLIAVLTVLLTLGQILAFAFLYQSVSENKLTLIEFSIFAFFFYISASYFILLGAIFVFLFFYVHSYLKRKNEKKNLLWFYSVYPTLVTSLLGYTFIISSSLLFAVDDSDYLGQLVLNAMAPIFPVSVNYVLLKLLKPNFGFLRNSSAQINTVFFTVINIVLSLCCILLYSNYIYENYIADTRIVGYYLAITFILTIVALLWYLSVKIRELNNQQIQQLKDEQLADLTNYVEQIEGLYNEIRSFRHDYRNVLISLNESIKTQDIKVVENTYKSILASEDIHLKNENFHLAKLNDMKVLPIKSILSAKVIKALQENIKVTLEITEPVTNIDVDMIDYVKIISILLDNAIEASIHSSNAYLSILFLTDDNNGKQEIVIENSTADLQININQIYEVGYSTKGEKRGIGLSTLRTIINNYKNVSLETESNNYRFTQKISIKARENT